MIARPIGRIASYALLAILATAAVQVQWFALKVFIWILFFITVYKLRK